jgi:hypothetical protein
MRNPRRERALTRQEARNKLTPNQQLDRLNTSGLRALKERRKLEKAIEEAKKKPASDKKAKTATK